MRRYKEVLAQLVTDVGGDPTEAQLQIARRAATFVVWCEEVEASMANGQPIDIAEFTTATNALRRLLVDLGLERRQKDITPDLSSYIREKAEAKGRAA
jgi:isopentenyldiphosphate isomerase